jgi:hypothetical protein
LINGAREKFNKPNPEGQAEQPKAGTSISATPYIWTEPTKIPPRDWIYGRRLIRKFISATVAPGGVGKSSLVIAESLAMVSGKSLLGVPATSQLRVWLWNLEDPREETVRRIQATAVHYRLKPGDIGDRLFVDCGREQPLVIAETQRNGAVICRPVVDALVDQLIARKIDVLIIDPFVSSHRVEENDNNAIDMVAKQWGRVADLANCAVELVHHTRKGEQEVTTESARGGKALTDACRNVRVVNRMSKEEGEKAGVDNHRLYFRTFSDKANLAPPADISEWFRLVSVDLENSSLGAGMPGGDKVGVVTTWKWPDPLDGITGADFDKAAAAIRAGRWKESIQAKDWVGKPIAKALGLDLDSKSGKARVKGLIHAWLKAGSLVVVEEKDDHREIKSFVKVADDQ